MAKKIKNDLDKVAGGRINVKDRIAMYENLSKPQGPSTKPTPDMLDIGERSVSFDAAKSVVARNKRPVKGI